jgi:hypothetical protein
MSATTSMLVTLETLPGWQPVPNPPALHVLGLFILLPLLATIIIVVAVKASELARGNRLSNSPYTDPTWIGSKAQDDQVLGSDNAAGQAAIQGGPSVDGTETSGGGSSTTTATDSGKGGASARW